MGKMEWCLGFIFKFSRKKKWEDGWHKNGEIVIIVEAGGWYIRVRHSIIYVILISIKIFHQKKWSFKKGMERKSQQLNSRKKKTNVTCNFQLFSELDFPTIVTETIRGKSSRLVNYQQKGSYLTCCCCCCCLSKLYPQCGTQTQDPEIKSGVLYWPSQPNTPDPTSRVSPTSCMALEAHTTSAFKPVK